MTVIDKKDRFSAGKFLKTAARMCLTVMRQETTINKKMLSVVSAGAAAGVGGMDRLRGGRTARELAATRDRQVRLHAVHTDLAINLPPSIPMPDGEEHPFSSSSRLHLRDPEQESEIHQKCIRPPPNRTVLESESPPPYRSNSAGLLGSSSMTSSSSSGSNYGSGGAGYDWSQGSGGASTAPLVVRCHSMSSSTSRHRQDRQEMASGAAQKTDFLQRTVKIFTGGSKKGSSGQNVVGTPQAAPPVVIVPTRPRRTSTEQTATTTTSSTLKKPSV